MPSSTLTDVVLLCSPADARYLGSILTAHNPALRIASVATRPELETVMAAPPPGTRLIAFFTGVVVPAAILARLSGPAYNFHPGPPAYPGRHPIAFALYEGAARYGATAHEMAVRTDSGPIVGALEFDVPPGAGAGWLKEGAFRAMVRLFLALAPRLAASLDPLPHAPIAWGERRCSQRELDTLRHLPPDIDAAELERRAAALAGEGEAGSPFVTLHGRRFVLAP